MAPLLTSLRCRPCTNFFLIAFTFGALLLTVANADFENFLFNAVMVGAYQVLVVLEWPGG